MEPAFDFKNSIVFTTKCKYVKRYHNNKHFCWCCKEEILDNEECVLLVNNYVHIPNIILHKDCFEKNSKEEICEDVEKNYNTYKNLKKFFE